jgi:hypothetical protein
MQVDLSKLDPEKYQRAQVRKHRKECNSPLSQVNKLGEYLSKDFLSSKSSFAFDTLGAASSLLKVILLYTSIRLEIKQPKKVDLHKGISAIAIEQNLSHTT